MSFADLGLSTADGRTMRFAVGFLAGSALTVVWFVIVTVLTGATWHLNPTFQGIGILGACAFNFFNNVGEELVYRGYAFARLVERFGPVTILVATSAVFALLHVQGGVPLLNVLAGVFTSGLIFGAIFARWRSVPLALGFHVATNIVQDVSGLRVSAASLFAPTFAPTAVEAGPRILAVIALVNVLVALGLLTIAWRPTPLSSRGDR